MELEIGMKMAFVPFVLLALSTKSQQAEEMRATRNQQLDSPSSAKDRTHPLKVTNHLHKRICNSCNNVQ